MSAAPVSWIKEIDVMTLPSYLSEMGDWHGIALAGHGMQRLKRDDAAPLGASHACR